MDIDRFVLNSHGSCDMCGMELLGQEERVGTTIYVRETDLLKEQGVLQSEIDQLKADRLEMAQYAHIMSLRLYSEGLKFKCGGCGVVDVLDKLIHKKGCLTEKAQQIIKESK